MTIPADNDAALILASFSFSDAYALMILLTLSCASSRETSFMNRRNSSPPSLQHSALSLPYSDRISPISFSALSPASWPLVSLILFRLSTSKNTRQPAFSFIAWAIAVSPTVLPIIPVVISRSSEAFCDTNVSMIFWSSAEDSSKPLFASVSSFFRMPSRSPLSHMFRKISTKCGSNCLPLPSDISLRIYS